MRTIETLMTQSTQCSSGEENHRIPPNRAANNTLQANSTHLRQGAYGLSSPQKQMNPVA